QGHDHHPPSTAADITSLFDNGRPFPFALRKTGCANRYMHNKVGKNATKLWAFPRRPALQYPQRSFPAHASRRLGPAGGALVAALGAAGFAAFGREGSGRRPHRSLHTLSPSRARDGERGDNRGCGAAGGAAAKRMRRGTPVAQVTLYHYPS